VLIGLALLLAILIKIFLVQAFFIPSGSMEETLQVGDRVLVNKLVYRFRDIGRGEVVVFNGLDSFVQDADMRVAAPSNALERVFFKVGGLIGVPQPGEKDFIKRVIGLPGDVVACCTDGHVTVNGVPLDESSYVFEDNAEPFSETVPKASCG
jgi:signal peptidase I